MFKTRIWNTNETVRLRSLRSGTQNDAHFLFLVLIFWVNFGGKMGEANTCAPYAVSGIKTQVGPLGELLDRPLSRNRVFVFRGEPLTLSRDWVPGKQQKIILLYVPLHLCHYGRPVMNAALVVTRGSHCFYIVINIMTNILQWTFLHLMQPTIPNS